MMPVLVGDPAVHGWPDDALLTTEQAANIRGRSVHYLAKERHEGRGPRYVKDGARVFYRLGDLRAWQDAHTVTTTDQPGLAQHGDDDHGRTR